MTMVDLNPIPLDDWETKDAPIIVAESNQQANILLRRALSPLSKKKDGVLYFKNIFDALETMKKLLTTDVGVSIVISDIFLNENYNIFRLIKEMESTPGLWNTALILYTNEADAEMFNRVRKDIKHIPFKMIHKTNDAKMIEKTCRALIEYQIGNRYYLELETSIKTYLNIGRVSLLGTIMKKIDEYIEKYPKVFHTAKVGLLKGNAYFGFWQKKSEEAAIFITELEKYSPSDPNYTEINEKLNMVITEAEGLLSEAEKNLLAAFEAYPKYWQVINALYWLYMEQNKPGEAKKYLIKLINLFPQQTEYSFQMGKLIELEGDFSGAIQHYLAASRNASQEGMTGYKTEDIMEIVDQTLECSKKVMKKIGISQIKTEGYDIGSEEFISLRTLQQVNAQVRVVMEDMTKRNHAGSTLYNKIGITYRRVGNYKMASEMYVRAIKEDPNDHRIRINYAALLGVRGSWNLAEVELEKAISLDTEGEDREVLKIIQEIISKKNIDKLKHVLV